MRIGQFIDTDAIGGAETLVLELCTALRDQGHHPILLYFGNRPLASQCSARGIEVQQIPDHRLYKSARHLPRFIWRFRGFLRGLQLDALHSHLLGAVGAAALSARLAGIPHVGTLHDSYSLREAPAYVHLLRIAAWSGSLVTVSQEMSHYYRQWGGFGDRLRTIYNGVRIHPIGKRQVMRDQLGIPAGTVVMSCVARLVPLKSHRLLLDAMAGLRSPTRSLLLIIGDGALMPFLREQAQRLGLTQRVRFLGERHDVPELLAASDLFILASDTEGLSCSLLESMAAGLPAVATRVGGNVELVVDGETGLLVPARDPRALVGAMERLVEDPLLRQRLGAQAAERAKTRFSLETMADSYLALYRNGRQPHRAWSAS